MFDRSFVALGLSVTLLACGGNASNSADAASEPAPGEPVTPAAGPGETAPASGSASVPAANEPASAEAVSAGTSAAQAWLALVDGARYDASWDSAASAFRAAVTSEAWSKSIGGLRAQMGQLVSRRLASASYTTSLPGVPDGKYVVLQFDTSFENKASAVETVTPMQDADGAWRVAGYFIK